LHIDISSPVLYPGMKHLQTLPSAATLAHAGFLAFALLFAQWIGIAHTIAHADQFLAQNHAMVSGSDTDQDHGDSLSHSCLLFDAITLSAALHTAEFGGLKLLAASVPAMNIALLSWEAPFSSHFSSRAPPSA
jgi:hypothetical protein